MNFFYFLPIAAISIITFVSPALADLVSPDGRIRIKEFSAGTCSADRPSGTYQVNGKIKGILYQLNCGEPTDLAYHIFIDTAGSERCLGRRTSSLDTDGTVFTSWKVDGSVPGYRCSNAGSTFTLEGMK